MPLLILVALCLSACSTPNVRCDAHLQPINAPGPISSKSIPSSSDGHAAGRTP
jgi:hypothetical protein